MAVKHKERVAAYLSPKQIKNLDRISVTKEISRSEVIRRAVDLFIEQKLK